MTSLADLTTVELHALARLVDEYRHTGDDPDPRPTWRTVIDDDVRRRMSEVIEGRQILEAARAARAEATRATTTDA